MSEGIDGIHGNDGVDGTDGTDGSDRNDRDRTARALGPLVQLEAHRTVSEAAIEPDPARLADGWERRFIADGARAEEAVALYRELGYEVVADPVRAEDLGGDCEACRLVAALHFRSIYTRERSFRAPHPPVVKEKTIP